MLPLFLIALFGALGCLGRYLLAGWVNRLSGPGFPYGTLSVNLIGAFIIGLIMEFSLRSSAIPASLRVGITIGFLGGFTTFSTFSYETFRLLEDGELLVAMINVTVSVMICLTCTWLGIMAARQI
ncbi:MAG TPA: fluoride efflux transporter CrcB [Geobacterales bacterium]|nr:fluoride efflux transporter CrcB [Geobacterales bacterium]